MLYMRIISRIDNYMAVKTKYHFNGPTILHLLAGNKGVQGWRSRDAILLSGGVKF